MGRPLKKAKTLGLSSQNPSIIILENKIQINLQRSGWPRSAWRPCPSWPRSGRATTICGCVEMRTFRRFGGHTVRVDVHRLERRYAEDHLLHLCRTHAGATIAVGAAASRRSLRCGSVLRATVASVVVGSGGRQLLVRVVVGPAVVGSQHGRHRGELMMARPRPRRPSAWLPHHFRLLLHPSSSPARGTGRLFGETATMEMAKELGGIPAARPPTPIVCESWWRRGGPLLFHGVAFKPAVAGNTGRSWRSTRRPGGWGDQADLGMG
jgi:hypothetical protein